MIPEDEKYYVSLGMRTYGGSAVKALGHFLALADHINTAKIKYTWPEYWNKYLEMGKKQHEIEQNKLKGKEEMFL